MNLILLNFKNYYDRKGYRYETVDEYADAGDVIHIQTDYDFNPNDGIWANVKIDNANPYADYLLVTENDIIVSRWYIIDSVRLSKEKYKVSLLRDVIADYRDIAISTPCFIEKATVSYGNPLLFNPEDMTFNQIKTSETRLNDKTLCPWIVGYIKRETPTTTVSVSGSSAYYKQYASLSDIPYYSNIISNKPIKANISDRYLRFNIAADTSTSPLPIPSSEVGVIRVNASGDASSSIQDISVDFRNNCNGIYYGETGDENKKLAATKQVLSQNYQNNSVAINAVMDTQFKFLSAAQTAEFLSSYPEEGTIVSVENVLYKITRSAGIPKNGLIEKVEYQSNMWNQMLSMCRTDPTLTIMESRFDEDSENFSITYGCVEYYLYIEETTAENTYSTTIPGTARRHLDDAPYDMFCIPYNTDTILKCTKNGVSWIDNADADAAIRIATALSVAIGDQLVDLQLLPYLPIRELISNSLRTIEYGNQFIEGVDYNYIKKGGEDAENCNIIFWCSKSTFSLTLNYAYRQQSNVSVELIPLSIPVDASDAKVQAMCDMYRLCSPNYSSQFEFNAVKNEGVDYYRVDCTYKPYSPYIRVAPNFKGLYGGEYGDARGLILSGDFSLATLTNAWTQYEINNKNYLNAFDRQIENLEINQKYQRVSEIIGAGVGTLSAGAHTGMVIGGITGAGGAIAAGASAALLSGVAGAIDVSINDKLRNEAIDYAKDNFGYSLGNIRAMPNTLNRVSAFNINNKLFPVLEYYTCTEVEKQALRDKIKYNGMSVGVIGTIQDYIQEEESYIKGRIIRVNDLSDDYHVASVLAEEIYKGVFI